MDHALGAGEAPAKAAGNAILIRLPSVATTRGAIDRLRTIAGSFE